MTAYCKVYFSSIHLALININTFIRSSKEPHHGDVVLSGYNDVKKPETKSSIIWMNRLAQWADMSCWPILLVYGRGGVSLLLQQTERKPVALIGFLDKNQCLINLNHISLLTLFNVWWNNDKWYYRECCIPHTEMLSPLINSANHTLLLALWDLES